MIDTITLAVPSLAVIIPLYKDWQALERLLPQLTPLAIHEIIISVAPSSGQDDNLVQNPKALIDRFLPQNPALARAYPARISPKIKLLTAPKGRGAQIDAGIKAAKSDFIWVLHADSLIHIQSAQSIRDNLAQPSISLGCFTLKFSPSDNISQRLSLGLFAYFSRFDSPLTTFGDQGFFFRRADYTRLKCDLNHYPLLEDVALRRALKDLGAVKRSPIALTTSSRRFMKRGIWKTQYFNLRILWRYWRGESPKQLYQDYYGSDNYQNKPSTAFKPIKPLLGLKPLL